MCGWSGWSTVMCPLLMSSKESTAITLLSSLLPFSPSMRSLIALSTFFSLSHFSLPLSSSLCSFSLFSRCDLQVSIPRGKSSSLDSCCYFDQWKHHSMIMRPFLFLSLSLSLSLSPASLPIREWGKEFVHVISYAALGLRTRVTHSMWVESMLQQALASLSPLVFVSLRLSLLLFYRFF